MSEVLSIVCGEERGELAKWAIELENVCLIVSLMRTDHHHHHHHQHHHHQEIGEEGLVDVGDECWSAHAAAE